MFCVLLALAAVLFEPGAVDADTGEATQGGITIKLLENSELKARLAKVGKRIDELPTFGAKVHSSYVESCFLSNGILFQPDFVRRWTARNQSDAKRVKGAITGRLARTGWTQVRDDGITAALRLDGQTPETTAEILTGSITRQPRQVYVRLLEPGTLPCRIADRTTS